MIIIIQINFSNHTVDQRSIWTIIFLGCNKNNRCKVYYFTRDYVYDDVQIGWKNDD